MASIVSSSSRSWLTTIAPDRQFASSSITAARPWRSRLLVGSSSRMKSGSASTRAAIAARVRCPPDSVDSNAAGSASRSTRLSTEAMRDSSVQSADASSSPVARPSSAWRNTASAFVTPIKSASVSPGATCTAWRRTPSVPLTDTEPACDGSVPAMTLSSVVLPTPLRPTRPVRPPSKLRSRSEKRARPSGVVAVRPESVMEGMDMDFPGGKASGHCGQVEIH